MMEAENHTLDENTKDVLALEIDGKQQQQNAGEESEEGDDHHAIFLGGRRQRTTLLFVACGISLALSFIVICFLDSELAGMGFGIGLFVAILIANAFGVSYIREKGFNVLVVILVELTVLCLPFVISSKDPLMLLPPAIVLMLYLVLLLPLDCFKEKMLALRMKSEGAPSPRVVSILDRFFTCLLWLFALATIVTFVVMGFSAIFAFSHGDRRYRVSLAAEIISVVLLAMSCFSLLYLVGMVFRSFNPLRGSARERQATKSEQRAAKFGTESPTGVRSEIGGAAATSTKDNELSVNIV